MRIAELEELIKHAHVIDESEIDVSVVSIGSVVTVFNRTRGKEITYYITGSNEADPVNNRISEQSPVGMALLGAKEGDSVTVETGRGPIVLEVNKVGRE